MIPDLSPVVSTAPEAPAVEPESDGTFPLDAFIIPEDARRVPAGFAASGEEENQTDHAIRMVAETLERFAMDLRRDGPDSLTRQLSSNDELEALLSAVLTGYIARHSG